MTRFQALTNAVLDQELEMLREHLGLAPGQKAELLREVATLAAWVVRQAEQGRTVEARRGDVVERLTHPAIERLQALQTPHALTRLALTDAEAERLNDILGRGFKPPPALRTALANLADPARRPPKIRWKKTTAA